MRLHQICHVLLLAVLTAGLNGCNLMPTFDRPRTDQYGDFRYRVLADSLASVPIDTVWWQYFGDSTLNTIIDQVSINNNDLKAALNSYEQARALARIDRSFLLPTVNTEINTSRTVISENAVQQFSVQRVYELL